MSVEPLLGEEVRPLQGRATVLILPSVLLVFIQVPQVILVDGLELVGEL